MNNFAFRFKQTKLAQFPQTNLPIVQSLEQIRKQINNFHQQECLLGNLEYCAQLEKILSQYVENLDTAIDQHIVISVSFAWNDSYEPNKFVSSNVTHYEFVCQLYNLGMLYYHIATNTTELKNKVDNGRYALWCFQRLQESLVYVNSRTIEQLSDLSYVHIYMMYSYVAAQTYQKLYEHFIKETKPEDKLNCLSLLNEAIKNYEQTIRCLIQTKQSSRKQIPPIIYNQLMQLFTKNVTISEVTLFIELAMFLYATAQDALNEKRLGKALTYLKKSEASIKAYQKKYNNKEPVLNLQMQQIQTLNKEYQLKNQQIYKQELAKEYELLVLSSRDDFLKPKPPPVFQQKFDQNQQQFQQQIGQLQQLTNNLKNKKDKAQQAYVQIQGSVDVIYSKYNLQYMMDALANADKITLTPSIDQKVKYIQEKKGWKGLKDEQDKIQKLQTGSSVKLINIKNLLDQQARMEGPPSQGHWLMNQQIEQFRRAVDDIQQRLTEASLINKATKEQIDQVKDQIIFVEQNNNANIVSKVQQSMNESQRFYQENILLLRKISTTLEVLKIKLDKVLKKKLSELDEFIDALKLEQMKQMDQFMYDKVNQSIDEKVGEILTIISSIKLNELEDDAKKLSDKMNILTMANQTEQEFEANLQKIAEAFANIEYAKEFYDAINQQIQGIETQIQEYLRG